MVSDFELYKSGIPAEYGGRISSVFDIDTKTGNRKKFAGQGGISPVTSRLLFEGPVVKDKGSYLIGGRATYSDWLLDRVNKPEIKNSEASFYDITGKMSYSINDNNTINFTVYNSSDYFKFNADTVYNYNNRNGSLRWRHVFTNKLIGNFSAVYSNYSYNISSKNYPTTAFNMGYNIDYSEAKAVFSYFAENNHKYKFGLNSVWYNLRPGNFTPNHDESLVEHLNMQNEKANETALFFSDEVKLNANLLLYGGIRYSMFTMFGPIETFDYYEDLPLELSNVKDSTKYGKGQVVKNYHGPELRASIRYKINAIHSLKLSYNRMRQYLHMLSNTTAISPTDTWKLSDKHIAPQVGDQLAVGYYRDIKNGEIETSAEIYYKRIKDMIEYKGGAELLLNPRIETDLVSGVGQAYGAEVMVKKKHGRLNGWASYTYSRILMKVDSEHPREQINGGEYFPANYDKPHDFTMVANYKFSRRFSLSSNFTYSTGRPITYPAAQYRLQNISLLHYTQRNEYRIPDYCRLDLSANLEGNLKSKKLAHSSLSFSLYNVLGRSNVYSIYFDTEGRKVKGYKLSVFARPIFTITYNFKF